MRALILAALAGCAQTPSTPPPTPSPDLGFLPTSTASSVYFVGHSLVNHDMPAMLAGLARGAGFEHRYDLQIKNGAPLRLQWEGPPGEGRANDGIDGRPGGGGRAEARVREALSSGAFSTVILTERVPLADAIQWECSWAYALELYNAALAARPDARVFYYETWNGRGAGWAAGIEQDRRRIVDKILAPVNTPPAGAVLDDPGRAGGCAHSSPPRARRPGGPMGLIPAGRALARLVAAVEAGQVPGVASAGALFTDDIHLSDLGNYFIALVHLYALYGPAPTGLPRRLEGEWGKRFAPIEEATGRALEALAKAAVAGG